jgi:hypothetical protein
MSNRRTAQCCWHLLVRLTIGAEIFYLTRKIARILAAIDFVLFFLRFVKKKGGGLLSRDPATLYTASLLIGVTNIFGRASFAAE